MKKNLFLLFAILITTSLWSQIPEKMSYQAVVRNDAGQLVTNTAVRIKVGILNGIEGDLLWQEEQMATTNINGLLTIEIGSEVPLPTDKFSNGGTLYLKTEIDPSGGTNYTIKGTSQLLSVPYALHAKTAETATETDPAFTQHFDLTGAANGDLLYFNGIKWIKLPGGTSGQILTINNAGQFIWVDFLNPPSATTSEATDITSTEAMLNGVVNTNGVATNVIFEFGTATSYGNTIEASQSPVTANSPANVSTVITGLTPDETYHFRVKVENEIASAHGEDMSFITLGYMVNFDSQGGSSVPVQYIARGSLVTEPTVPIRTSYTFGGWYKETDCINPWNFSSDIVTTAITLYAKWTATQANHLIISEVAHDTYKETSTTNSSEYIEIYNPNSTAVVLGDTTATGTSYFISDITLTKFAMVATEPGGIVQTGTASDQFIYSFPHGAVIPPGGVVVVTCLDTTFLSEFFSYAGSSHTDRLNAFTSQPGNPQLFATRTFIPEVSKMIRHHSNSSLNLSLKNNTTEVVILYSWDRTMNFVVDHDIAGYTYNYPLTTFDALVSRPQPSDTNPTWYQYKTDSLTGYMAYPASGNILSVTRIKLNEPNEITSDGNGFGGHDETTEWLHLSFESLTSTPGVAHPDLKNGN